MRNLLSSLFISVVLWSNCSLAIAENRSGLEPHESGFVDVNDYFGRDTNGARVTDDGTGGAIIWNTIDIDLEEAAQKSWGTDVEDPSTTQ